MRTWSGPGVALTWAMAIDLAAFSHLTQPIIGAAIEVHRHLGPGLLESVYQACLARELASHRLSFVTQRETPVIYKGVLLPASYRLDLVVEGVVIVVSVRRAAAAFARTSLPDIRSFRP